MEARGVLALFALLGFLGVALVFTLVEVDLVVAGVVLAVACAVIILFALGSS